jgi:predicted RNA-binding Zn-ribbon protein involved in translation (DUF1610 family)
VGIAIFFLIAAVAAAAIVYPLLPGRGVPQPAPGVSSEEIEEAVRDLRRVRSQRGAEQALGDPGVQGQATLSCPACGHAYRAGDRFCVRCGGPLPEAGAAGLKCPSCGASLHEGDLFCARCGRRLAGGEVA